MAGIEKICEFSGEYPGYLMYGYKRNLIQIMPKYRKLFRGAKAHIEINEVRDIFIYKFGGYTDAVFMDEWEKANANGRLGKQYYFTLVVDNAELSGEVNGRYYNWTLNMNQTLKRLKRMLRCRDLKVVKLIQS